MASRAAFKRLSFNFLAGRRRRAQGAASEAESLYREALTGMRSALGDAHPRTQELLQQLLGFLSQHGKAREARELRAQFGGGSGK